MSETRPPQSARQSGEREPRQVQRRKRRRGLIIKVDPKDLENEQTLVERLKKESVTGVPGLLASLLVHAVILAVLALMVIKNSRGEGDYLLQMSWLSTKELKATKNTRVAMKIEAIENTPKKSKKKKTEKTDDTPVIAQSSSVKPVQVENTLAGRNPKTRAGTFKRNGADDKTERAISTGLMWLKRQQQARGNWKLHEGYPDPGYQVIRTDTGASALALLAYLGAGNTHQSGDHQETVAKGLSWLKGIQKPNGDLHDHVEQGRQTAYYAHSQATIALCEAYAMTHDESLRDAAERAIRFLLESQHPTNGGWRYQPQEALSSGDLSVTGWALMALHTARIAGIEIPLEEFNRASVFIDSVQEMNGARYKYMANDPSDRVSAAMTAEGLLCRQWLGWPKSHPAMSDGVRFVLQRKNAPEWSTGRRNVYSWYYTAQLLHNLGGDAWKEWYKSVQTAIIENQTKVGSSKKGKDIRGSWHPTSPTGAAEEYANKAGRLYITAMCILILETPVRHAPVYPDLTESEPAG